MNLELEQILAIFRVNNSHNNLNHPILEVQSLMLED